MEEPSLTNGDPEAPADLERRLLRYRRRLEAEGRTRSLSLLDRAIRGIAPKREEH